MSKKTSEDWRKGYAIGKKIKGSPYPIVVDDFCGDRDEFMRGLRFAGFRGEVQLRGLQ